MSQLSLFKSKRQRGVRLPAAKEIDVHIAIADILRRWHSAGWQWGHYPAGEWRNIVTAMKLKRMGVQPGWTDFILLAPSRNGSYFLELKRRGLFHKMTDEQLAFADWCDDNGYPHAVVDTFEAALAVLQHWRAVRVSINT